ncbi:MAG: TRAP transporter small permease subunit [Phycisphaerales bacterium]
MIAVVRRINLFLDSLLYLGTAVSAMAFFAVVVVAMAARSIATWPFHSSVELSRLFFVWSCFLAAALAYRKRAHVGFTLLLDQVPAAWRRRITGLNYLLILGFAAIVLVQSTLMCRLLWPTVLPILGISQAWFYVPVPILCLCMILYTAEFMAELDVPPVGEGGV